MIHASESQGRLGASKTLKEGSIPSTSARDFSELTFTCPLCNPYESYGPCNGSQKEEKYGIWKCYNTKGG